MGKTFKFTEKLRVKERSHTRTHHDNICMKCKKQDQYWRIPAVEGADGVVRRLGAWPAAGKRRQHVHTQTSMLSYNFIHMQGHAKILVHEVVWTFLYTELTCYVKLGKTWREKDSLARGDKEHSIENQHRDNMRFRKSVCVWIYIE